MTLRKPSKITSITCPIYQKIKSQGIEVFSDQAFKTETLFVHPC